MVGMGALVVGMGAFVVGMGALVVGMGALVVGMGALVVGMGSARKPERLVHLHRLYCSQDHRPKEACDLMLSRLPCMIRGNSLWGHTEM